MTRPPTVQRLFSASSRPALQHLLCCLIVAACPVSTAVAADSPDTPGEQDFSATVDIEAEVQPSQPVVETPLGQFTADAWIQSTYRLSRASESEVLPDGRPRNVDGFFVDRAQLGAQVERGALSGRFALELTTRGAVAAVPRRAQVTWSVLLPDASDRVERGLHVTAGQQSIPFGLEVRAGHRDRWFADRTLGSSALFPGLTDAGVRAHGGFGPLRAEAGLMQGEPVTPSSRWNGYSPTRPVELSGRTGLDVGEKETTRLTIGISALLGEGFHVGRPAGTDGVTWVDYNENGTLDAGEVVGVPGRAAQRSHSFERWAIGGDMTSSVRTPGGLTLLQAEVIIAQNLDRGFLVSDPITAGLDLRQLSWFVALHHEFTFGLLVAFRHQFYDPHADFLDDRRGVRVVADAAVRGSDILLGWSPAPDVRLTGEFGINRDELGRNAQGEPENLDNNTMIFRLHVGF